MWKSGDRVSHRFNAELGPGLVVEVEGRRIRVFFPESGETLQIAAGSDVLEAMELVEGGRAKIEATGEIVRVEAVDEHAVRLADGRELSPEDLWPIPAEPSPLQRLKRGQIDSFEDFRNRLDGLRLLRLRQADGLGSFLGGRIRLFPHQLYAAEKATAAMATAEDDEPGFVRWLLADEVGLGKTVEACLIMNRLLHRGRVERALVVAPDTLTVQWLGELWRKYHQIFVLLDTARLKDVVRDHGEEANPFEVHPRSIISLERLSEDRRLQRQAVEAGVDLLVVDEAHHLRRPAGHPGNAAYRAVRPITELGKHVLLLSATPLEDDAHGFFRLLQLLRPDELPEEDSFEERLARRDPLPPCTSAARRADIGGMPPRAANPIDLEKSPEFTAWNALVEALRQEPAKGPLQLEQKAERIWRATASAEALAGLDDPGVSDTRLETARQSDPRVSWIVDQARGWAKKREKVLVFVAHKESLDLLRREAERRGRAKVGVFHEDLSAERRDLEVAQFRLPEGPSILISTECGGEGRNFEFCDRLVLFDLPWHPAVVEQRIGRLDRIGRSRPTEIVYFRPPSGFVRSLALLYEAIGLFEEPLGGLERELSHVAARVSEVAMDGSLAQGGAQSGMEEFQGVLDEAREAADRVRQAAYHELHRDPYTGDMASSILERVPEELDGITEDVVMRAAARFGFGCERQSGARTWLIEYGSQALVDHIPGVAHGARFLGTFDRERAVEEEELDFFASGHALVEGILAELEDGPRGRVALVQVAANEDSFGLLAIYRDGFDFEAVAVDQSGEARPDLAAMLMHPSLITEPVDSKQWTSQPSWPRGIKRLAKALPNEQPPEAVAAFRIRKRR